MITIIFGSPRKNGNTASLLASFVDELDKNQAQYQIIDVYEKNIHGCRACLGCQKDTEHICCVINDDILEALQQDEKVWKNFCSFPELYQRIRVDNIQGYKDKEQSERRLQKLIDTAREGVMYGEWNDYGQLL